MNEDLKIATIELILTAAIDDYAKKLESLFLKSGMKLLSQEHTMPSMTKKLDSGRRDRIILSIISLNLSKRNKTNSFVELLQPCYTNSNHIRNRNAGS